MEDSHEQKALENIKNMVPSVTAFAFLVEEMQSRLKSQLSFNLAARTRTDPHFPSAPANHNSQPRLFQAMTSTRRLNKHSFLCSWDLWDHWEFCHTMDVDLYLLGPFPEYGSTREEKEAW